MNIAPVNNSTTFGKYQHAIPFPELKKVYVDIDGNKGMDILVTQIKDGKEKIIGGANKYRGKGLLREDIEAILDEVAPKVMRKGAENDFMAQFSDTCKFLQELIIAQLK